MDPVSKFIATWKIPVGKWGKALIDFIVDWFQWLFDGIERWVRPRHGTSADSLPAGPGGP